MHSVRVGSPFFFSRMHFLNRPGVFSFAQVGSISCHDAAELAAFSAHTQRSKRGARHGTRAGSSPRPLQLQSSFIGILFVVLQFMHFNTYPLNYATSFHFLSKERLELVIHNNSARVGILSHRLIPAGSEVSSQTLYCAVGICEVSSAFIYIDLFLDIDELRKTDQCRNPLAQWIRTF